MKYYAVRSGRKPGIYTSWPETQEQIRGFSNAVYKSFPTRKEAEAFMDGGSDNALDPGTINEDIEKLVSSLTGDEAAAFVDGSYSPSRKKSTWGVLILPDRTELSGICNDPRLNAARNFSGELVAAMKAVEWALKHDRKKLLIFYDYAGIEQFARGRWTPKNELARFYVQWMKRAQERLDLVFYKIQSHTGVIWNEEADRIASQAWKQKDSQQ